MHIGWDRKHDMESMFVSNFTHLLLGDRMYVVKKWSSWLFLALTFLVTPAHAGLVSFDFLANDGSYSVTGVMTVADVPSPVGNGQSFGFDILGISGFVTDFGSLGFGTVPITGLVPNPNQPGPTFLPNYAYNNIYFPFGQTFDVFGVLFTTGFNMGLGRVINWNIWVDNDVMYNLSSVELNVNEIGMFTSTPPELIPGSSPGSPGPGPGGGTIPEPGTFLLLGLGLLALAFTDRQKQSNSNLTSAQ